MQYIKGKDRKQCTLFPHSLDDILDSDNDVRLIDLFAESINLLDFRFHVKQSTEGRPAYHPKDLLKLFVYGYLNGIRSSRALEKQCHINIEVRWLMRELAPDHNTIANFRRDNPIVVGEFAPLRYTDQKLPPLHLLCGDSKLEWPARVEENALMAAMIRTVTDHNVIEFHSFSNTDHGSCVKPSVG